MSATTDIAWTDSTWNPVRGCTKVSAGCKNCYAERFAERFRGVPGHPFEQGFDVRPVPEALELPLRWRKPRRVFVNSMSDLFHEDVPDNFIDRVFAVMALAGRHTFQVLTKRADRMARYVAGAGASIERLERPTREMGYSLKFQGHGLVPWPLPNVHLLVSVEDQPSADERIPLLLATPAAVCGLSCEPLLARVDFSRWLWADLGDRGRARLNAIGWVIVGGESGPGARPMRLPWAADIAAQCKSAGVPVFVKQLGAVAARECRSSDKKGADMALWPPSLRVREFPKERP